MPKTDRTRPFSPLFAGRCRGRCLCRNWFGLPPEDDRICRSGRNAVERRNLSALFAVRSGRPETCHVRTQTNNHHCAKRAIISALHRRRERIGRRRERPSFTRSLRALAPVSPLLPLFSRCIRTGIRPEASFSRGLTGRDTEEIVRFPSPAAGIPWRMRNKTLYLLRLTDF